MSILEDAKEYVERATGLRRPGRRKASEFARARKPHAVRFKDDGLVPNHPRWPFVIYRSAVDLGDGHDPAAVMEDLFEANGWGDTWRDGIQFTRCSALHAAARTKTYAFDYPRALMKQLAQASTKKAGRSLPDKPCTTTDVRCAFGFKIVRRKDCGGTVLAG
jgi:hypothetical protein